VKSDAESDDEKMNTSESDKNKKAVKLPDRPSKEVEKAPTATVASPEVKVVVHDTSEKKFPNDAEIRMAVQNVLNGVDLSVVSMKNVLKSVSDTFPTFNLTAKKDFIKNIVKEMISNT